MTSHISDKTKARLFALLMFGIAVFIGLLMVGDSVKLIGSFTDHRTLISSEPLLLSGLFLVPLATSIGVIILLPRTAELTPEQVADFTKRYGKWVKGLLVFILLCVIGALTASYLQYVIVDHLAQQRGYVPCPTPHWPRHQNDRWALPGPHSPTEHCPGEGTDANL